MKILYISYFYPPLGGPAVFRNLKTVKYLTEAGAIIDVITVQEIEYLYRDPALSSECKERKLIRAKSLDLMTIFKKLGNKTSLNTQKVYLGTSEKVKRVIRSAMLIDDKIGWLPGMYKSGKIALKTEKYDLIYVSCGPFSAALGAYLLSKHGGVPLVIDYRDYWSLLDDYFIYLTPLHKLFARYWEKKILAHASAVVTATKGIGTALEKHFGSQLAGKLFTMYNGWDETDFEDLETKPEALPAYEIAYFGAIYARRNLKNFYRAVKELREADLLPSGIVIRLYGNYFVETHQEIEQSGIADLIEIVPQIGHKEALLRMKNASLLLLMINSDSPEGTLTSKVFEYLRVQNPILAMIPAQNEAAQLLRACGHDCICPMESSSAIKSCLKRIFEDRELQQNYHIPHEYERFRQIEKLYNRLNKLASKTPDSRG